MRWLTSIWDAVERFNIRQQIHQYVDLMEGLWGDTPTEMTDLLCQRFPTRLEQVLEIAQQIYDNERDSTALAMIIIELRGRLYG